MKWISFLLAGLLAISSYGGIETEVAGREGSLVGVALDEIHVQDQWYTYMLLNQSTYGDIFCVNSKKVGVKFWMDREMLTAYAGSWELQITYDILLAKGDGGPTTTYTGETLTLQYDPAAGGNYNDIILKEYNDYMFATLSNMSITYCPGGGACPISAVPDGVHLDAIVTTERFYKLDATEIPVMKRKLLTATNELDLRWNYIEGAESYDLEWVFVDLPDELFTDHHYFDFRNATRINVPTNHYDLSMAFPRGILVFRVRPRGRNCTSTKDILGSWSYDPHPDSTYTDWVPSLGLGAVPPKWEWDGIELDKNWQYQVAYSEDGKRKEAISFFDGSLRNRESITILNTDDHAIAGQSIYDYLGRPALQVLPAPMLNEGIRYYDSLSRSSTGVYDYTNFDYNGNLSNPDYFDTVTSKGAGYYYSMQNSTPFGHLGDYTPTANGKPFTRVRYKNDGTGRIHSQAGVGEVLGVGGGHQVNYFYAAPGGQAELDRLFGSEVGFVQQYKKNMVVDPNGQTSVTYVDQNGRTIATALAGDPPGNLDSIDTKPLSFDTIVSDLTDFNTLSQDGTSWELSHTFAVPATADYTFDYKLDSMNHPGCYGDEPCVYDIVFALQDEDGNYMVSTGGDTANYYLANKTSHENPGPLTYTLTPGVYTATKRVMLTESLLEAARDSFLLKAPLDTLCGLTVPDSISGTPCNTSCEEICDSTYINVNDSGYYEYLNGNQVIQATVTNYNGSSDPVMWDYSYGNASAAQTVLNLIDDCMEECTKDTSGYIPDWCEHKEKMMEIDMSPGGQYFDNTPYEDSAGYLINDWLDSNVTPTPSTLTFNGTDSYDTWDSIRDFWQPGYENTLVIYHPEYCIWQHFCPGECGRVNDAEYLSYIYSLDGSNHNVEHADEWVFNPLNQTQQTDSTNTPGTYQPFETYTNQWGNYPTAPEDGAGYADPWFDTVSNSGCFYHLRDSMEQYLLNYLVDSATGNAYSIWYVLRDPEAIAQGNEDSYPGTIDSNIVKVFKHLHGDGASITGLIGTGSGQISEYEFFRSTYNFYRDLVVYEDFITNTCPNDNCVDSTSCWLTHDGYGYTAEGFQVRCFENQAFEAFLDGNPQAYAEAELDTTCKDECADKAAYWSQHLADDGCIDSTDIQIVDSLFYEICILACDSLNYPSSQGDSTAVSYGGNDFYDFNDVVVHYSGQCTGCSGTCDSIVFPAPPYNQNECSCDKITDFVQAYYDRDSIIGGDVYDPITEILNAGGDTADFHAELDELLDSGENTGDFDILNHLDSWLDSCKVGGSFADTLLNAFKCDTIGDFGDTISAAGFVEDCGEALDALANYNLFLEYEQNLGLAADQFIEDYKVGCFSNMKARETLTMTYELKEYHYTLYFYDQADNLIKTVPPSGVYQQDPKGSTVLHDSFLKGAQLDTTDWFRQDSTDGKYLYPDHVMITNYQYNSLQKLMEQTTPDGGTSHFWYDALDRIVLSRNAKQLGDSTFSYTLYDELGRVYESGEVKKATNTYTYAQLEDTARTTAIFTAPTNNSLYNFIQGGTKTEVSRTWYDQPLNTTTEAYFDDGQNFLRTRIATVTYEEFDDDDTSTYDIASHYSYDIHGNVDVLIQENKDLEDIGQHLKTITYEYDLISGNVNQVNYQAGKYDEFYHRYCYDADNRITEVFTSRDGMLWERDEKQLYYAHGPLARKEIGDLQVQACDHVYNAQGWLKTVNSSTGNQIHDAGVDGVISSQNQYTARDATGFSLHYFDKDYQAIGTGANSNVVASLTNTSLLAETSDLYNGNISVMVTGIKDLNENHIDIHANAYKYDQLNRIKEMNVYQHNAGTDPYDNAVFGSTNTNNDNSYHTEYTFDGNGNIHSLQRYDNSATPVLMDDFNYHFHIGGHADSVKENNRLEYVADAAGAAVYNDISNTQTSANYVYDSIGQLIKDVDEKIDSIAWDVRNKVLRIIRTGNGNESDVEFHYDALGQRVSKIEIPRLAGVYKDQKDWIYTYYTRDAQGNVLGVYKRTFELVSDSTYYDSLQLIEHHIYGSSRAGLSTYADRGVKGTFTANTNTTDEYGATVFTGQVYGSVPTDTAAHRLDSIAYLYDREIGMKQYELTEHRGNVLSVITDQRLPVDSLSDGTVDWFTADIISYADYLPYGMLMTGRNGQSEDYRYGFNGMETDDEVKGIGNHYDFGARCYDSRVGRWFSADAVIQPYQSPYNFVSNDVVRKMDPDGNYERDGHYYTVYYVALYIGLTDDQAKKLAEAAEAPDTGMGGKTAFGNMSWANSDLQYPLHSLAGKEAVEHRNNVKSVIDKTDSDDLNLIGYGLHALGDTYAHIKLGEEKQDVNGEWGGMLYGNGKPGKFTIGHYWDDTEPDLIKNRPEMYTSYGMDVANVLTGKFGGQYDPSKLESFLSEVSNYAKDNDVSLIGIMNYELAKLKGEKSFFIYDVQGNRFVDDGDKHDTYVQNTKDYLDSKGVKYTTEESTITNKDNEKVRVRTEFKIVE